MGTEVEDLGDEVFEEKLAPAPTHHVWGAHQVLHWLTTHLAAARTHTAVRRTRTPIEVIKDFEISRIDVPDHHDR